MASTNTTNLTQELFDMIAMQMLVAVDDRYMFYDQGPILHADQESQTPGAKTINFDRPVLPTGTYTEASRRLTDGTPVDTTGVAITETQVQLVTREYGGPHDGTAVRPFRVTELLKNRAIHNVVAIVGEFMRRDRMRFLDTTVMNLLLAATTVVTPSGDAEAAVATGQVASVAWLRRLNKTMKDAKIPVFPDGHWRLITNTTDEANLKSDPEYREAYRYFQAANPALDGTVMRYEGFNILVSTLPPTNLVGAGGNITGFQSVAYGPNGVGHGISTPPSVRYQDDTDFQRQQSLIWKSEEAIGTLYSDLIIRATTT